MKCECMCHATMGRMTHEECCPKPISTPTERSMEERFDREFKHVHHPMIQAENIIRDTAPIIAFITQEKERSVQEGKEAAMEFVQRVCVETRMADGFIGFTNEQWQGVRMFLSLITNKLESWVEATRAPKP